MNALAHAEDGLVIESIGFDFDAVDRNIFAVRHASDDEICAVALAAAGLQNVVRWQCQNCMNNPAGLIIRAKIFWPEFVPEIQESYNLTELAGEGHQAKQSFGRWQDEFKRRFPRIANIHKR